MHVDFSYPALLNNRQKLRLWRQRGVECANPPSGPTHLDPRKVRKRKQPRASVWIGPCGVMHFYHLTRRTKKNVQYCSRSYKAPIMRSSPSRVVALDGKV